jgi:hypothetical protein
VLAPQVPDVDVEGVRRRSEAVTPHPIEDHVAGEHEALVAEEQLEQFELEPGECDRAIAAAHLPRPGVEDEIAMAQHARASPAPRVPPRPASVAAP